MKKVFFSLLVLTLSFATQSCSDDDSGSNQVSNRAEAIKNYTNIVHANYSEAYWDAVELEDAINSFNLAPTLEAFEAVKLKWKEARESYGTTEAFRFEGSPVETVYNQINAWPLDEAYIDYTDTDATAGIINNTTAYPELTKEVLSSLNQVGGAANISTGYHAIEFLLWGQDLTAPADNLSGQRPYTDFVDGEEGTAENQDRRRQYLSLCADLLTDNLESLAGVWAEGGSYRATFLALDEATALQNIFQGIINVTGTKLPTELINAVTSQNQENEQSQFSDYTQRDFMTAFKGVLNVYRGQYGTVTGTGIQVLVYQGSTEVYTDTQDAITLAEDSLEAIVYPFDYAISGGPESEEGKKVVTAAEDLTALAEQLRTSATTAGVSVQ
ncbi:hypothetical protein AM493_07480 [Flavobacterium akiainvivens]|uniref:Imelysin-like domain-containing protein n=1 Tax=Flavobacterium akiainvivens TaxID=1202724 RepID=A0A0M8MCG3_9FLAO|nr:imelysin family protein [Flavobacterium akiainvivens]KOS05894.1 hypothetical protein AM493_07480 [Flavobacterium akiainvivens]SFQ56147.1 putative iron-regulated protein [Flavobacterium akiainvivens]